MSSTWLDPLSQDRAHNITFFDCLLVDSMDDSNDSFCSTFARAHCTTAAHNICKSKYLNQDFFDGQWDCDILKHLNDRNQMSCEIMGEIVSQDEHLDWQLRM